MIERYRPQLTASTKRKLGRLVRAHGVDAIIATVRTIAAAHEASIRNRRRGRRSTILGDMLLANYIYENAERLRGKTRKPVEEVELELYSDWLDEEQRRRIPYTRWQKRIKRIRLRGLEHWQNFDQRLQQFPQLASALGDNIRLPPAWLTRRVR